jgi:hypothetical protein
MSYEGFDPKDGSTEWHCPFCDADWCRLADGSMFRRDDDRDEEEDSDESP